MSQGRVQDGRWIRRLLQLDQDAVRGGRVDERDQRAFGTRARRLVDQAHALVLQPRERRLDDRRRAA